jgi:hypothetical protein
MLFMSGDFGAADKVFQESLRREFPYSEVHSVHFRPLIRGESGLDPFQLRGKVTVVQPKHVFIESEGYPRFFCSSSKFSGIQLKVGMPIQFDVVFSAKGAIATKPVVIQPLLSQHILQRELQLGGTADLSK